jgi:hypothetical protein
MLPTAAELASAIGQEEAAWGTEAVEQERGIGPAEVASEIEPAVRIA